MENKKLSLLELFCSSNKDKIIGCAWIDGPYCLKTCKYYENQKKALQDYNKKPEN
jgi:hypothetical protein